MSAAPSVLLRPAVAPADERVAAPVPAGRAWSLLHRRGPCLAAGGAAVYAAGVLALDPFRPHALGCPVLAATGLLCPGCGSTRAAHELLHGDVAGSLACHPFVLPVVVVLVWMWLGWVARRRGSASRWAQSPTTLPPWALLGLAAAFVTLAVLRNLPGFEWLTPPATAP